MSDPTHIELQDRIEELEEALHQAQGTVEFLHGCLTDPVGYSYDYPEQTIEHLARWAELAPCPPMCVHSRTTPGCESCEDHVRRVRARAERAERASS